MHVASAPYFDRRLSTTCSILAPLKQIKARRNDRTDVIVRYQRGLRDFHVAVSVRTFGSEYFDVTGELIPSSLAIYHDHGKRTYLLRGDIYAPVRFAFTRFQAIVTEEWAASKIAGNSLFFRSQPYGGWGVAHLESNNLRGNWWHRTFGDGSGPTFDSASPVV